MAELKCLNSSNSPPTKRKRDHWTENEAEEVFEEDFLCPICLHLLIEPVVMPCKHELCKLCFTQNVQEANLQCPICRVRISSWARKQARNGTLVCQERWKLIQKLFSKKCERRMAGEDDELEDSFRPRSLKRILSENGAIRSEYEEEMRKICKAREEEIRASEELIHRLMEQEEIVDPYMQQMIDNDEELAKRLQQQIDPPLQVLTPPKISTSKNLSNKTKGKSKTPSTCTSHTLEKWFSPTKKSSGQTNEFCLPKDLKTKLPILPHTRTCHLSIEKQQQEEEDYVLAKKLQEEFDNQGRKKKDVNRKKGTVDGYLLRKSSSSESSS